MIKTKVLLVDDEEEFCSFLKKGLETVGNYEVSVCFDSTKVIKQAKEVRPDLILLDIAMPHKNGFDVAAELKSNKSTKDIPFVFLSAMIDENEVERHKDVVEKERFISKPVKIKELASIIDRISAAKKAKKEKEEEEEKRATVTFLSRSQIDFLDKLGKDTSFYYGFKLSRGEILSELVDFLMKTKINIKDIDLNEESLSKGILKIFEKEEE